MNESILPPVLVATATSIALYSWYNSRRYVPLPPGPKGHWLFGSAMEILNAPAFYGKLAEYTDQYGPLVSVRMVQQHLFVISDPHLVTELFEKRATNYSDRDENQMLKLTGWDTDTIMLQYGPTLKLYRAMLNRTLNNRVAQDYIPLQQHEIQKFMKRLLKDPEHFLNHVQLLAGSIAARLAYGYQVESFEDPFIKTAKENIQGFVDCIHPWNWMVNIFPLLRYIPNWLPIAPFQRRAREVRAVLKTHREMPFAYVQKQVAAGTAGVSFVAKLLHQEDGSLVNDDTKEHIKRAASTLYAAGSDTTVSVVQSFFLAMVLYPETQAKAQEEIAAYLRQQSSIGEERLMLLPDDRSNLPYTSALVRELQRWHPVVPVITHRSSNEDDNNVVSNGKTYRIPARSLVLANVWKITHDPTVYEDPNRFKPERFLAENPPPDPENYTFGFGRRICPGMHVAQQSMWMSISNVLANFMIARAKDENGAEVVPEELYTNENLSHPMPFSSSVTLRNDCQEWLRNSE